MFKVIGIMLLFWILLTFGAAISVPMFSSIVGGGVPESFLYPIYFGIMLLAGLIVACTIIILNAINNLKDKQ